MPSPKLGAFHHMYETEALPSGIAPLRVDGPTFAAAALYEDFLRNEVPEECGECFHAVHPKGKCGVEDRGDSPEGYAMGPCPCEDGIPTLAESLSKFALGIHAVADHFEARATYQDSDE